MLLFCVYEDQSSTFYDCVLRSVQILSPDAFSDTTTLLYFIGPPTECTSCCGCSFLVIPTDVIAIADNAFYGCGPEGSDLKKVVVTT